jgi:hypothetical protein
MADKFLGSGGGIINLSNGTANIFAGSVSVAGLDPSQPVRTNSLRQLVSSKLAVSDINNLQSELGTKQNLDFVKSDTHANPPAGQIKIYAKNDGDIYKKDENGVETDFGGGSGLDYNPATPSVENGMIFTDGTSATDVKNITGYRYDATNNKLVVPDIETDDTFSLDAELQKLDNVLSAVDTVSTTMQGSLILPELETTLIKSTAGNVQVTLIDSTPSHPTGEFRINSMADIVFDGELYCYAGIGTNYIGGVTNDDEITFDEVNGRIRIRADIVQTDQTVFTDDRDVASKKYVDDTIATTNIKTQNISATDTDATKTRMTQLLELGPDVAFKSYQQWGLIGDITLTAALTVGWQFSLTQKGTITRFNLRKDLVQGHRTLYLDTINTTTNSALLGQQSFTTNQDDGTFYYYDLPTPIVVEPAPSNIKYLVSAFLPIGDKVSTTTTPRTEILTGVESRFNATTSGWTFPDSLQDVDDCNIISFDFNPAYDVGGYNLKAYESFTQNSYVNNSVISGKNKYGFVLGNELVSKDYVDDAIMKTGDKTDLLALVGMTAGQQFYMNANPGTNFTSQENKLWTYTGRTWQVVGETIEMLASEDMIVGNTIEVATTDDYSIKLTNSSEDAQVIGVVALNNLTAGDWGTVAINGIWEVACENDTYTRAIYLTCDATNGLATKTTSETSKPFAKVLENRTINIAGGLVFSFIHTAEIY